MKDWKKWDLGAFWKKNGRLVMLAAAGVCLIFLGDALFASEKQPVGTAQPAETHAQAESSAEERLEARLTELLSGVEGAGAVRVMVTLESAGETVYAIDEETDTQTTSAEERRTTYRGEHVLYDAGNGRQPLVESRLEPEVRGVAVVCEGGDDITVIRRVTDLVTTVLNLPSNRVCVTKGAGS